MENDNTEQCIEVRIVDEHGPVVTYDGIISPDKEEAVRQAFDEFVERLHTILGDRGASLRRGG